MNTVEHCDNLVRDTEAYLARLDGLHTNEVAASVNVQNLKNEIYALHRNDAGLEQKTRATRLGNAVSLLSLLESDLAAIQEDIKTCKGKIAEADRLAKESLKEISWELLQLRKAKVEAHLAAIINFTTLLLRPEDISRCARSVLEVEAARNSLTGFIMQNDFDGAVASARQTREFGQPILDWCADELLPTNGKNSVDVQPSALVEQLVGV